VARSARRWKYVSPLAVRQGKTLTYSRSGQAGLMLVRGPVWQDSSSHVCGAMKLRGAPTPADSTTEIQGSRGKGGPNTVGSPAASARSSRSGADTAVSLEREVVSGHAYAILTLQAAHGGGCGYDKPMNLSVDGVFDS
jgi:hypothetical protein